MNLSDDVLKSNCDVASCSATAKLSEIMSPTVFIVDDDASAARQASAVAESLGLATRTYTLAESFLAEHGDSRAGCVVAEAKLPGLGGVELLEELSRRGGGCPVVITSAFADVSLAVRAIRAGAIEVLQKPCSEPELAAAIRTALARDESVRARTAARRQARERLQSLSEKERQVLDHIMSGRTTKEIARALDVSLRTVELRRRAIFEKMQTNQLASLVRTVLEASEHLE